MGSSYNDYFKMKPVLAYLLYKNQISLCKTSKWTEASHIHKCWRGGPAVKSTCCSCRGLGCKPHTHMVAQSHLHFQVQRILTPSSGFHMHMVHINSGRHPYTQKNQNKYLKTLKNKNKNTQLRQELNLSIVVFDILKHIPY